MKRSKTSPEPIKPIWREERKTLTLCGEPVLELSLSWPEFPGKGGAPRRMTAYYARLAQACCRRWERETYCRACLELAACREKSRIFRPWSAQLSGAVTLEGDALTSLRMDLRECGGDGRAILARTGLTWRLKEGAPVPLGQLMPERRWRRPLLDRIEEAVQRRRESGTSLFDPDCGRTVRRRFSARQFCLTPEGLEVFYSQCLLGPALEGIPTFLLPVEGAPWLETSGDPAEETKQA